MTYQTSITLRCDGPDCDAVEPADLGASTVAEARSSAAANGWLVSQGGGRDYCNWCRPQANRKVNQP